MDVSSVKAVFDNALAAHEAAAKAKEAMAALMLSAFQKLLPPGTIIDLRYSKGNPPPDHMIRVRTMSGNDRGTKLFRVVKVVYVEASPIHPELSTWVCDAVPISEKTGKDMKASPGNGVGRDTVRLHGNVGSERGDHDPLDGAAVRLLDLVAQNIELTGVLPFEPTSRLIWSAEKPTEKGVYAWKGGPAMLALVLVHLRPSAEAPGGVLKGQVLGDSGSKFYDGCAIEQWTGEWIGPLPQ